MFLVNLIENVGEGLITAAALFFFKPRQLFCDIKCPLLRSLRITYVREMNTKSLSKEKIGCLNLYIVEVRSFWTHLPHTSVIQFFVINNDVRSYEFIFLFYLLYFTSTK